MLLNSTIKGKFGRWWYRLGLGAFVCMILLSIFLIQKSLDHADSVERTQNQIRKLSTITILLERAEAGYRGFLLTTDPRFLRRYHMAAGTIDAELDELERLLGNPKEGRAFEGLKKLREAVRDRYIMNDEVLRMNTRLSHSQMVDKFSFNGMKPIRDAIDILQRFQNQILLSEEQYSDLYLDMGLILIGIGAVISLVLTILGQRALSRSTREHFTHNSLLTSILENLTDGLAVVDAKGDVLISNPMLTELLGLDMKSLDLNKARSQVFDCYDPLTRRKYESSELPLARALTGQTVQEMEIMVQPFHLTREILLSVSSRPIWDPQKKVVGAMAVYRDITKRRQMEKEWQKAREAALETAQLKSDFLTQMGHEIRTPMNGVLGLSSHLMNSKLDKEQSKYVRSIRSSAQYLLNLIQGILDQSQIEKQKIVLDISPIKIHEFAVDLIGMMQSQAEEKGAEFYLESELPLDLVVMADAPRLQLVLSGLLEQKGLMTFKVRILESFDSKVRLCFEIRNSNSNLESGDLIQRHVKSLVSSEIIELMGGALETETRVGFGTRTSLTVDFPTGSDEVKRVGQSAKALVSNRPVLVAEDQAINQMVIKKYLERLGLECHIVTEGRAAFLEAISGRYSLVLMDCKMQPIDGYEATQMIRRYESGGGERIPIIALTADGTSEDRRRCQEVGMDDYIVKPVELNKLEFSLQKWTRPVIKEELLKKLGGYEMEGRPLVQVLADDYFSTTPGLISKLEKAVTDKNLKQVQYLSHTLKSSSLTLGLVELGSYCEELESIREIIPSAWKKLERIKEAYARGEPILRKWIY